MFICSLALTTLHSVLFDLQVNNVKQTTLLKLTKQIWNRGQPSVSCNRARACTPNVVYQQNYEHNILINTSCIIYSPNATRHAKREKLEHASRVADLDQFFFFNVFVHLSHDAFLSSLHIFFWWPAGDCRWRYLVFIHLFNFSIIISYCLCIPAGCRQL